MLEYFYHINYNSNNNQFIIITIKNAVCREKLQIASFWVLKLAWRWGYASFLLSILHLPFLSVTCRLYISAIYRKYQWLSSYELFFSFFYPWSLLQRRWIVSQCLHQEYNRRFLSCCRKTVLILCCVLSCTSHVPF